MTVSVTNSDTSVATVDTTTLTFTTDNWNQRQTVIVRSVDDDKDNPEDIRRVTITHTRSDGGSATLAGIVTDDDGPGPGVTVSDTAQEVLEDGGTDSYTLVLVALPNEPVTVSITSSDTGAATVSHSSLTFTTSNWNVPKTVTVTGVDDGVDNPNTSRTVTISHSVSGGGYDNVTVDTVTVAVVDY